MQGKNTNRVTASTQVRVKPLESFDAGANNIVCDPNPQNQGTSRLQRHMIQTSRRKVSNK